VANAAVDSALNAGVLTVTSTAGDAITITCSDAPGNDVLVNGNAPGTGAVDCDDITEIVVDGDDAANDINLSGVSTAAGKYDHLTAVEINGNGGNDTIRGSEAVDTMNGGGGNDRISGDDNAPATRDVFHGDAGDDTLVWNPGDDDDLMEGDEGSDTIEVNGGNGGEQFTIKPSPTAGRVIFDRTGPSPTPGPFNLDIGTSENLQLNANGGDDTLDTAVGALATALDLRGGAGNDTLDGGDGADKISGGEGNDRLIGDDNPAGTDDDVQGDAGDDTMVWNPGDDDDLNEGGDGTDTVEVNGGGDEQFTINPSPTAGRVLFDRVNNPFNIDIGTSEKFDVNTGAGIDSLVTAGGDLGMALDVDGGVGDDTLDGSDGADVISGGEGDDRLIGDDNPAGTRDDVRGDAGNDTMVWNPGDDDDLNEGGDGDDTVEVNGGNGGEQFTVNPSETPGRVLFDRTGPSPTPGPFNVDIGTSETLDLNANGGDDTLDTAGAPLAIALDVDGGDGNDKLRGSRNADLLAGGAGDDVIRSKDKVRDSVDCGTGVDLARVDQHDTATACDVVIGGALKVRLVGKPVVRNGVAVLRLRCVNTEACKGAVVLQRGGKKLGKGRFKIADGRTKKVRVKLNSRGRRLAARDKGVRATVRIDSRDGAGNGWRVKAHARLKA
jgi:Ca2+-binding RTX toxin-like protein